MTESIIYEKSIRRLAEKNNIQFDLMKENLAKLTCLTPNEIGITAGTNEKLGYVGEGKGITVYAYVLMNRI